MSKPGDSKGHSINSQGLRQLSENRGEVGKEFAKETMPIGSRVKIVLKSPTDPKDVRHATYVVTGYQRGRRGGVIPRLKLIGKLEYGSSQINNLDKLAYWTDLMHSAYKYSLSMKITK